MRGEEVPLRAEHPIGKRKSPDAAVAVTGNRQIRAEETVFPRKAVVPVREQQPEGVAAGGVDLLGKLLRRFLIGVAVRIVDAREDDTVAVQRGSSLLSI